MARPRNWPLWIRRAQRGQGFVTSVNHGTVSLFNDDTAKTVLVVRDAQWGSSVATSYRRTFYSKTRLSGGSGVVQPLVPEQGGLFGQIDQSDQVSQNNPDYHVQSPTQTEWQWLHDFPIAVVLPGWSFCVQDDASASTIVVSFLWECIGADELEPALEIAIETGLA